jgi:uncharacterized coiled-coil protein SlyX
MINKLGDLASEVRILELEVKKIALENLLAQLKAEQTIDEGCVGCCKVVDIAADLQKKLDDAMTENVELSDTIDRMFNVAAARERGIADLNRIIEELNDRTTFDAKHIDRLNKVIISHINEIRGLDAELSARKEDSKVLVRVVEIVKNWDDSTGRAFPTLIKILDELVDYTVAPEGPEDPNRANIEITVASWSCHDR